MSPEPGRIGATPWQQATIEKIVENNYRTKSFTFRMPNWRPFRPGQHFRVRLTAPDGYQAQRSYSIASAPEQEGVIDLTIELVDDGEVSPYFHDVARVGDEIELKGPIGGPFTWSSKLGGPLLLVAGGSGVVPLMSMLRHRRLAQSDARALLLYSSRTFEDIIYREELDEIATDDLVDVLHTLTRSQPDGWNGHARRIDRAMLEEALGRVAESPHTYVCGPTPLVESVAAELVNLGVPAERVRTERFGPSA